MTCTPIAVPASTSTTSTVAAIQTFMERKNIRFIPFAVIVLFFTPLSRKQQKRCHLCLSLTARNHVGGDPRTEIVSHLFLTDCHEKMTCLIFRTIREKRLPPEGGSRLPQVVHGRTDRSCISTLLRSRSLRRIRRKQGMYRGGIR